MTQYSHSPPLHLHQDDETQPPPKKIRHSFLSGPDRLGIRHRAEGLCPESLAYIENYFRPRVRDAAERAVEGYFHHFHKPYAKSGVFNEAVGKEEEVAAVVGGSGKENLRLCFMNNLPSTIYTTNDVEAENGEPLQIELFDVTNNTIFDTSHPLSSALVEVVVLHGEFDDEKAITHPDFDKSIVSHRLGERPFLIGDDKRFRLRNGVFFINKLSFTTNSSRTRTKNIRLGLRIIDESNKYDPTVRPALSNPFRVKDHRGELSKKHHPPRGEDDLWRLEGIARNGEYHNRLYSNGIKTVDCFVKAYQRDCNYLRKLLGNRVPNKEWKKMVNNALEYVPTMIPTFHPPNFEQNLVQNEAMGARVEVANQITAASNGHGFQDQTFLGDIQELCNRILEDYHDPTSTLLSHGEASTSNTQNQHVENTSTCNQYLQGAAWNKLVPKPK